MNDDNEETYWTTNDGIIKATLKLSFEKPVLANVFKISEFIPLGQRIKSFHFDTICFQNMINKNIVYQFMHPLNTSI